ncbi:uncharacterized protein L3040_006119 [Drepanopeziza brunnea f. sp. 'multigermtubi']|uniref:Mitochondrial inner membrane protease subunit 2 n=1 Tax=Marssonina brunnea f. sp. multigermtubi (strain MB_m1) TaxID=1072389 RepID=K1XLR7_MARBU|nr:uncharacterized protein MBM_00616 [Drepanopeziza brunnea f. sp. 'multigermtubi' MB_m1]EKD21503.1 hypothetical protein MBM_00616 [Drepanopeziza brunnea f. sp. 'multigermtubi' MB_m1]KAJ5040463.1 hypothetical protein L3040_006119 [Drepanopeziza brunnea f. sp. 'multigermtubi']
MASKRLFSIFNRNMQWASSLSDLRYWPLTVASWIPAIIFFNDHVGDVTWITGSSMYPFLNSNYNNDLKKDCVWNSKWSPISNLKRGMIVSFHSPMHPEVTVVKRVIALEGDIVYTRAPCPVPTVQVPVNHVWVEGDNRDANKTLDSNTYGPIPLNLIQGKITHVLWPLKSFGPIRAEEFKGRTKVIRGRRETAPGWD